jgi:Ca2+-binding RTX toxin-like protein
VPLHADKEANVAVSGIVSIPSALGSSTVFTVTGTRTLEYAKLLESYLDGALQAGKLNLGIGQPGAGAGTIGFATPVTGMVNEAVVSRNQGGGVGIGDTAIVPDGYQALFDNVDGTSTVEGNSTGLDGIFAGLGTSAATFIDNGGNNTIVFVDGNNQYVGDSTAAAGNDIIVAGSGFDTIYTGYGKSTVNSGVGHADINLHDTTPTGVGSYNDYVWMDDGQSTVYANGVSDAVIANTPGQDIVGGASSFDSATVVLLPGATGYGNDIVSEVAGSVSVFDEGNGNSVFGGSGQLEFIGGADVAATVVGDRGPTYVFGGLGDSISLATVAKSGFTSYVAGTGNETLNAAGALTPITIFGDNTSDSVTAGGINDSFVGGQGNDTFVSGTGNETFVGGGGQNVFYISATTDGVGANITISDFAASDNLLGFANYTQAEIQSALEGATTVSGAGGEVNTVITLADKTTVTFIGVSSLTGHVIGF